jgi:hypothetical protein
LLFLGAPLALAADRLGRHWLFYMGLAMLLVSLALPSASGQTLGDRARNLAAHVPGARLFRRRDGAS